MQRFTELDSTKGFGYVTSIQSKSVSRNETQLLSLCLNNEIEEELFSYWRLQFGVLYEETSEMLIRNGTQIELKQGSNDFHLPQKSKLIEINHIMKFSPIIIVDIQLSKIIKFRNQIFIRFFVKHDRIDCTLN